MSTVFRQKQTRVEPMSETVWQFFFPSPKHNICIINIFIDVQMAKTPMNIGINTIFRTIIEWQLRKNAWE